MEVDNQLGMGVKEIIYKDALEIEFKIHKIPSTSKRVYFNSCNWY